MYAIVVVVVVVFEKVNFVEVIKILLLHKHKFNFRVTGVLR